jgi:predicted phosphodiesterase
LLRFGIVTDCQYADIDTPKNSKRLYRLSPAKLQEAVDAFNAMGDLDFVIHLGDFIDKDFRSFDVVLPIYEKLKAPHYQVLGNHDYDVADEEKAQVARKMGLPAPYYAWSQKGWRLIVLDGNDISLFAHGKDSPKTAYAAAVQKGTTHRKLAAYNGGTSSTQLSWLRMELDLARLAGQKAILFCHYPALPIEGHALWNAEEIVDLIAEYPDTAPLWCCGHNHDGNYAVHEGIHFVNFKGMVDTPQNTYARVEADAQGATITGFGREPSRKLPFPGQK